jgi:hypothetical protein
MQADAIRMPFADDAFGAAYLRWSYAGGASHAWMSATSRSRRVAIT